VLVGELVPHLKQAVGFAVTDRGGASSGEEKRLADAAAELQARVAEVDREWKVGLAGVSGRPVVTHHNAFGRPAARYGFTVAAVIREFETSEPSPGDIAKVVEAIKEQRVRVIFVEPQFSQGVASRIGELSGVKVATLDPLGNGDWFALMRGNLDSLVKNLSDEVVGSGGTK
jgi:zinc transport system substrate-binding protein